MVSSRKLIRRCVCCVCFVLCCVLCVAVWCVLVLVLCNVLLSPVSIAVCCVLVLVLCNVLLSPRYLLTRRDMEFNGGRGEGILLMGKASMLSVALSLILGG
jgi:hypothetical protein